MRHLTLIAAFLVLLATPVAATPIPITNGTWVDVPAPCECGNMPYSNWSADRPHGNIGYVLQELGLIQPGLQFLINDTLLVPGWEATLIHSETDYTNPTLTIGDDGVITYDDHVGLPFTSVGPRWTHWFWFRNINDPETLYLGVNDTWPGDKDGQDGTYRLRPKVVIVTPPSDPPASVPEPSAIAMFGAGLLFVVRRWRRR